MSQADWRVEQYRGKDAYVLVSPHRESVAGSMDDTQVWSYEVRIAEEGSDPSDAGDTEVLLSGNHVFATRHAAEVAAFSAAYAQIDKLLA
ncbi:MULTISPECIES: hypothetical protein [unclassified Cupriavidus]|uniref:hypothetical protein n=1 Tax=Cupriavidus sp. H19C3 TaxID=3241603 RepID=UPI003BF7D641